ncbi:hypothetical protein K2X33_02840 [bacterium]|nr:hypothetical protein [bacterium]
MFLRPFLSIRNELDFNLRRLLPYGRAVRQAKPVDERLGEEIGQFLGGFDWGQGLATLDKREVLRVLDVGARNFATARPLHTLFHGQGYEAHVQGIEIDAYRRLADFRTRADYGHFHASKVPGARFHAMDFLNWKASAHVIFLLNPFVTLTPLLLWGLPRRHFRPDQTFNHAANLLKPGSGILVVSSPTAEEQKAAEALASEHFTLVERSTWTPSGDCVQSHPRLGALYRRKAA